MADGGTDWAALRVDYERTDIGLRVLAQRYGLKSDNSIRKRAGREGWLRAPQVIADVLAAGALALGAADGGVRGGAQVRTDAHPGEPATAGDRPMVVRTAGPIWPPGAGDGVAGAQARGAVVDLVEERTRAVRRQLELARRGMRAAEAFFGLLTTIADAPYMNEDFMDARNRLQTVNGDKDTLAGTAKSMADLFEKCAKMERLALGLDVVGARGGEEADTAPSGMLVNAKLRAAMALMDEATLMGLRTAAQTVSRQGLPTPRTIEGTAE